MEFEHISVLLDECIEGLNIRPDKIYVDGTMGGAGHSLEIAKRLTTGKLICIDQDENAHFKASKVLKDHLDKVIFVKGNFSQIDKILERLEIPAIDGLLLDLGVSSHQFDEGERGFSYRVDARLDMRMDQRKDFDAHYVVNEYSEEQLTEIISKYGEEKWAVRIAKFIVEERKEKPIDTTFELVTVIKKAIPKGAREEGGHPAKRTFQAIRIEVNNEIEIIEKTIVDAVRKMNVDGRVCVITFHSLEDRVVKNTFRELNLDCLCPRELPICCCDKVREVELVTKKPITASKEELEKNNRSRSAKLRIARRV